MFHRLKAPLVLIALAISLSGCLFYPYHHDHYDGGYGGGGGGGGYDHGPGGGGYYQH